MGTIMKTKSINNFVAKHAQRSGAGKHVSKKGKFAPRCKQKTAWKRDLRKIIS